MEIDDELEKKWIMDILAELWNFRKHIEATKGKELIVEAYFQKIKEFCQEWGEQKRGFSWKEAFVFWNLFSWIRKAINPFCEKQKPDFRTRKCKICRQQGNDIESCRFVAKQEKLINEALLDVS